MGTPRLSASVDQMRNVQRTASCGGAGALDGAHVKENCRSNACPAGTIAPGAGAKLALRSGVEPFLASGCETGAVFFSEVAQQLLLAQDPGMHAFGLDAFDRMQLRAETAAGAAITAATSAIETVIRASIEIISSTTETARRPVAFILRLCFPPTQRMRRREVRCASA